MPLPSQSMGKKCVPNQHPSIQHGQWKKPSPGNEGLPFSSVHGQQSINNSVLTGQTLLVHNSDYTVGILNTSNLALINSLSKARTTGHTTDTT